MQPVRHILRRLLLLTCCFLLLNLLLQDKRQKHTRLEGGEERRLLVRERQREVAVQSGSRLFSAHRHKRLGTGAPLVESPESILMQLRGTFPSQAAEAKNIPVSNRHAGNVLEVLPLWMHITDDLYVYSAFWDSRQGLATGTAVRMLGILRYQKELMQDGPGYQWIGEVKKNALNYTCLLWYMGQGAEEGQLSAFIYEEGLKVFVGTYFLCSPKFNSSDLRLGEGQEPYAVSLVPHGVNNTFHKLIYLSQDKKTGQSHGGNSAICVRPLFGPYTDVAAISVFLSYYSTALNISHFYFYDFAIDKKVRDFLMLLIADGDISIHLLPWNIPISDWEELWDLGSLTTVNDCIYRTSGKHSHVAIVDLDELIVPRIHVTTLGQLYTSVIKHKRGSEGDSVLILNAFFCSEFQEKDEVRSSKDLTVFKSTLREPRLWPSKSRSKMVVMPEAVVAVGHHMVHHFLKPIFKNQASPKLIAVLHHYRNCKGVKMGMHATGSEVLNQKPLRDKAILKYRNNVLASRITSQYLQFIQNI